MPDAPDWRALDAALDRALDLDGADRDAFLAALDADRRVALGPLLHDALADDPLLDHAATALLSLVDGLGRATVGAEAGPDAMTDGVRVGPYRIEALVGEGGMGRVYRARRADGAFDRTVALKVVRQSLTLAGADVAARLRRERALLAGLDHPGIARLLDGGETPDGVPFLVTEFVDGAPITDYADTHDLGVSERVRLVAEVARAVDHAHRRLVVHRDLKPSNVLVAEADGVARPVVLDFGIAKLLDGAEDAGSGAFPLTRTGMRLLTPAYAAPELYEPTATVTTAADVYGLGALLYELLTGRRPHDDAPTPGPPTTEPTRPSKVVTGSAAGADPPDLPARSRALRGDLDVICLRALHPDPVRRYASAAALADDLERHLSGLPVEARPDSLAYVAGRFVRRNRVLVAAASVALAALVVGLAVALVALGQARAAEAEAEAQAAQAAEATDFLSGLFRAADPGEAGRPDVTARDLLLAGRARVGELEGQPELQAEVLGLLAASTSGLGDYAAADSLYARAVALADSALAPKSLWRARLRVSRAQNRLDLGHAGRAAADVRSALALPGADDEVRARGRRVLAEALMRLGQIDPALDILADAASAARAAGDSMETARVLNTMGLTLMDAGRPAEALPRFQETLALRRRLFGERSEAVSIALTNVGNAYTVLGRTDEGARALAAVLALDREIFGDDHPYIALDLLNLGRVELDRRRTAAAESLLRDAFDRYVHLVPDDHPDRADAARLLAVALADLGRCPEALPLARRAAAALDRQGGANALDAERARATVGRCQIAAGRAVEGAVLVRAALAALAADPLSSDAERARIRSWLPPR